MTPTKLKTPIIPGIPATLGNFVLPLMLGAKDVALPRLNLASFWLWMTGAVFSVASIIIGSRSTAQLKDNLGAATWSLTDAEMVRLDQVSATPPIYPYDMHRNFMGNRNPGLANVAGTAGS